MAPTSPDRTGVADAYVELRALRTVDDAGLATYVAGVPDEARHSLLLRRGGGYRTLLRDEATPWCDGLDTASRRRRVAELTAEPVPTLLTLAEAAQQLPVGQHELNRLTRANALYPLYGRTPSGQGRVRYLFEPQVKLEALRRRLRVDPDDAELEQQRDEALAVWLAQRKLLPPLIHEATVDVDLRPAPSPDPLPLDPSSQPEPKVCIEALRRAAELGWLEYRHPDDTGYVVAFSLNWRPDLFVRHLPQRDVLPFLLGMADFHGRSDEFAYRAGLGRRRAS